MPAAAVALMAAQALAAPPTAGLRFLDSVAVADKKASFREPSGLALAADGSGFWSVSDETPAVHLLRPDGTLDPSRRIEIGTPDLEGITTDATGGRLLAVSEAEAVIIVTDIATGTVSRHPLAGLAGWDAVAAVFAASGDTDGLEGIAVHGGTGNVFVIKERAPRLLLELTPDLARIRGALVLDAGRGFEDDLVDDDRLDVSGLASDPLRGGLWIVSDTGARAFLLDLETLQARSWPLLDDDGAARIRNAEGVALSADGRVLSVVTDDGARSRLYRYAVEID